MSKLWIAIIVVLLIGIAGGGWFIYTTTTQKSAQSPDQPNPSGSTSKSTPTPSAVSLTEYTDESGFSFQYPTDLKLQPATSLTSAQYAKLTLTGKGQQFNILIQDIKSKTIADWLKSDPTAPKGATLSGAVTLGGISAEQYTQDNRLYTVAIDQGVLYLIDGPSDPAAESTYSTIIDTFAFAGQATPAPSSGTGSGDTTVYEEEEVIE